MLINIVGQWRLNDLDLSDDVSGVHCYRSNNYMLRERSKDPCQIKIYKYIIIIEGAWIKTAVSLCHLTDINFQTQKIKGGDVCQYSFRSGIKLLISTLIFSEYHEVKHCKISLQDLPTVLSRCNQPTVIRPEGALYKLPHQTNGARHVPTCM